MTSSLEASPTAEAPAPDTAASKSGLRSKAFIALLTVALAGGGFWLWRSLNRSGQAAGAAGPAPVAVTLEQLQPVAIKEQATYVGTLDAQVGVALQSEAAGRITRIYVSAGDRVAAGAPIMELSADRSQAELNAALASVSAARSARDNARAQVQSLRAELIRLEAEVTLQETEYDRAQRLVNAGALAQQRLDEIERDRSAAIASLNAARQEITAAQASLDQANAFLSQSQASASATQEDLRDRTVTAPIGGIVGNIPIELGDYIQPGAALTSITQNDALELDIAIPAEQASQVQTGMPVELLIFGNPEPVATASISFLSPQTDAETQTILAKAVLENPTGRLQDNQRVDARIILNRSSGLLVPATAVTRLGGQAFVYVATEEASEDQAGQNVSSEQGQVAKLQPVTLGAMQGNSYQVVDGLAAGDTIITTGLLNLQDGSPIQPQEPSAQQDIAS